MPSSTMVVKYVELVAYPASEDRLTPHACPIYHLIYRIMKVIGYPSAIIVAIVLSVDSNRLRRAADAWAAANNQLLQSALLARILSQ